MTPERWRQIDHLLEEALELEPAQRAAFIQQVCADDEPLRIEVETLLTAHLNAAGFMETPPSPLALGLLRQDPHGPGPLREVGPYRILNTLGAGGMGEVYLAEDTRLGRRIALKRLPFGLNYDPKYRSRLRREAQLASTLDHPGICTIHEIEESGDESFIAMQYVEGKTLHELIRDRPLPPDTFLSIALQVGDALAAAHQKGIVHRDIKSSNIMITPEGSAKILDFGIAKLMDDMDRTAKSRVQAPLHATTSGVMGTPAYMSPEQARGEEAGYSSDIFSFGVVLYEMATGRLPFEKESPDEIARAVIEEPHTRARHLNHAIPQRLEKIIDHALEKDPGDRYGSIGELIADLKEAANHRPLLRRLSFHSSLAIFLLILAILGFAFLEIRFRNGERAVKPVQTLAVLPLKDLSGEPDRRYLTDSMTEDLIAILARISGLRVISHASVLDFKDARKPASRIAKELNADAVLEGSVLQTGNRVRLDVRLIHSTGERRLWAQSFERNLSEILALQNEVASAVAGEIGVQLTLQEQTRFAARPRVHPAAYEAYLRGKHYVYLPNPKEEELRLGISMFERALELDANFATAHAMLSVAHGKMYHTFFDRSPERLRMAKEAADHALSIQHDLPLGHVALGWYHYWGYRDYDSAYREFSIALRAAPSDTNVLNGIGTIEKRKGNFEAALRRFQETLQMDPRNPMATAELGIILDTIGRYDEAQQYFDIGIAMAPDHAGGYVAKVESFLSWTGDTRGARALVVKIPDQEVRSDLIRRIEFLDRNYESVLGMLPIPGLESYENALIAGDCYRFMDRLPEAQDAYEAARIELDRMLRKNPEEATLHASIGLAYAGLRRKEEAIREARHAMEMWPVSEDAITGPYFVTNLAVVYVLVGESEAALDTIDYLLSIPTWAAFAPSIPLLHIDPTWDPLRGLPRFQKMLERPDHSASLTSNPDSRL